MRAAKSLLLLDQHSFNVKQSSTELAEFESAPLSSAEMESLTDHLFVPSKEDVDKLLRYEVMIRKQLNHAIAELERLQRRRNGGTGSAPESTSSF